MSAYYNEFDKRAAERLKYLIDNNLITPGDVDTRSIVDVKPDDIKGYTQCHWFAGIGGWSLGMRLAGWPDDKQAWSASLPCQPYSHAANAHGGAKGQDDPRHLLPHFIPLVAEQRPSIIFGEQVASAIKWGWLDEAFGAMEDLDYACGSAVLPALAVGARHERKRIYWVADARSEGRQGPLSHASTFPTEQTLALYGDPLAEARRALDGDFTSLLSGDGVSIAVGRSNIKGYGNAIVPALAAAFIRAAT